MPTLRLLRPLLARASSSCGGGGPAPPCPPCASPPPPPCRARPGARLRGRRVVCCPPPAGAPPPCTQAPPPCDLSCGNRLKKAQAPPPEGMSPCGAARDAVAERLRCFEEHHRRQYESAAARRARRPPAPPPAAHCPLPSPGAFALATDGRSYAVTSEGSATRPPAATACPAPCSRHPPPRLVGLAPQGDCRPKDGDYVDPCDHLPRTLLSVHRDPAAGPAPSAPSAPPAPSPKPCHANPKCQTTDKSTVSKKGITSRIMDSLRSGRSTGANPPPRPPGWCANPPPPAPAPPDCRPPTYTERLRRRPPGPGDKRRLHTAAATRAATDSKDASSKGAILAAAEKLAGALKEREQLKEAGRGRSAIAGCPPPPPPQPPTSSGELALGVPPGVDTVCVHVSMGGARPASAPAASGCDAPGGSAPAAAPPDNKAPPSKPCPPSSCGGSRAHSACSDSWLSIKSLQKKISSSCGRSETGGSARGAPPAPRPCAPVTPPAAPRASTAGHPCPPPTRVKMADVLPHTIFVKH